MCCTGVLSAKGLLSASLTSAFHLRCRNAIMRSFSLSGSKDCFGCGIPGSGKSSTVCAHLRNLSAKRMAFSASALLYISAGIVVLPGFG